MSFNLLDYAVVYILHLATLRVVTRNSSVNSMNCALQGIAHFSYIEGNPFNLSLDTASEIFFSVHDALDRLEPIVPEINGDHVLFGDRISNTIPCILHFNGDPIHPHAMFCIASHFDNWGQGFRV
jgi:hypothetical protein